MMDQRCERVLQ